VAFDTTSKIPSAARSRRGPTTEVFEVTGSPRRIRDDRASVIRRAPAPSDPRQLASRVCAVHAAPLGPGSFDRSDRELRRPFLVACLIRDRTRRGAREHASANKFSPAALGPGGPCRANQQRVSWNSKKERNHATQ